jgi:hypothetical protein
LLAANSLSPEEYVLRRPANEKGTLPIRAALDQRIAGAYDRLCDAASSLQAWEKKLARDPGKDWRFTEWAAPTTWEDAMEAAEDDEKDVG